MSDAIVYRYTPRFDGEYRIGVPKRDLTAADVARIDPEAWVNATAKDASGKALYTEVKPTPRRMDVVKDDAANG